MDMNGTGYEYDILVIMMMMSVFINIAFSQYTEESMNFGSFKGGNEEESMLFSFYMYMNYYRKYVKLRKMLGWI